MTSLVAVVDQALGNTTSFKGLLETYEGFAGRTRRERALMKRKLAYVDDKTLLDIRSLFSLTEAFHENGTPILGIAPYTAPTLRYMQQRGDGVFAQPNQKEFTQSKVLFQFTLPDEVAERDSSIFHRVYEAVVPPTPKALLPWNPLTRRKLHVLFDADWKQIAGDPYLLERVNENQFRIVEHWDLTEKEREIMKLLVE